MKAFLTRILWIRIIHWTLLILMLAEILSGLGILYGSTIQSLIPVFSKALVYKMHIYLVIPLIVALALHIFVIQWKKMKK